LLFKAVVLILLGSSWATTELEIARGQVIEPGFESLFDGQTLDDWGKHLGAPTEHVGGRWEVIDGAITGFQDPPGRGGFLVSDRKFGDFVLRLDARLDYPVDSGIFLRVGKDGKSHQVTLDHRPKGDIGAIYLPWTQGMVFPNPLGGSAFHKDGWNRIEILMQGEPALIRVRLNGRLITDFQHTETTTKGVGTRGGIALQVHPDVSHVKLWREGNRVRFRNIRIKVLDK
jgi:hypothetical protein